jgi:hypothetical protein
VVTQGRVLCCYVWRRILSDGWSVWALAMLVGIVVLACALLSEVYYKTT